MAAGVRAVSVRSAVILALGVWVAGACAPALAQTDEERTATMIAELGLREAPDPVSAFPRWKKPRRVLVRGLTDERRAWVQAVAPGVELVGATTSAEMRAAAASVDAVIGDCGADLLEAGADILWMQSFSAGVERCLNSPLMRERGVLLTNMQRVGGPPMADHVMAFVLAHARGLPDYLFAQRDGQYLRRRSSDSSVFTLTGKTMLVVGFGGVGSEVARRAHAFGMTVLAIRNSRGEAPPFVSRMGLSSDLPAWVKEADVVVNTLPLTQDTRGMFDAKIFAAMKRTAFFVNVGRGATVVTADLLAALQEGRLGGAGLDVVDPEPVPPGHPLWKTPRLLLTPHMSAQSDLEEELEWLLARENLRRYAAGGRMLSVVDPERGY